MNITKDIKYVGVNDRKIDLFEGQYVVPNGMSYNSYVILDDKIAVINSNVLNILCNVHFIPQYNIYQERKIYSSEIILSYCNIQCQ